MNRGKDTKNHYFDKEEIHRVWADYEEKRRAVEQHNTLYPNDKKIPPKMPDLLARKMMEVATKAASAGNWRRYPYIEDMIAQALLHMILYARYDASKVGKSGAPNPFGYLSKIAQMAFLAVKSSEDEQSMIPIQLRTEYEPGSIFDGSMDNNFDGQNARDTAGLSLELYQDDLSRLDEYNRKIADKKQRQKDRLKKNSTQVDLTELNQEDNDDNLF